MFTCGLDRSNFSFAITISSLHLPELVRHSGKSNFVSVVGVQLEELRTQIRRNLLERRKIELANHALVAIGQVAVLDCSELPQNPPAQNILKVTDAETVPLEGTKEVPHLGRRERCLYRGTNGPI